MQVFFNFNFTYARNKYKSTAENPNLSKYDSPLSCKIATIQKNLTATMIFL